ncbi:toll-like receptor 13 [Aricia agestis]|uniref:toll-like receptor 13 n=1 Tax=Aricia agestis TaxID=91739 RepID=UPI001C206495|nr:toll-like receptor 13 [Aricia agestis]
MDRRMILRNIVYCTLLCNVIADTLRYGLSNWQENPKEARCLTGYMTDVQKWVDKEGHLINVSGRTALDLSLRSDPIESLQNEMTLLRHQSATEKVKYLSMAKCSLTQIPPIFNIPDNLGRRLADTAEYISFYGNNFSMHAKYNQYDIVLNASDSHLVLANDEFLRQKMSEWSLGFRDIQFNLLKELDLRACSIQVIGDFNFRSMPNLTHLYLGENNIYYVNANAFRGLKNLRHLDMSRNYRLDENGMHCRVTFENLNVLRRSRLESLDFSFTRLEDRIIHIIARLGDNLQKLSLCYTGITKLPDNVFQNTSLRYLDISGNVEALSSVRSLKGTEDTLQVVYAKEVILKNMKPFENFTNLEVLKISYNNIRHISGKDVKNLKKLQILDLDNNKMSAWFQPFLYRLPNLKVLSLRNNNINVITEEMFEDFKNLSYVSFSGNFMVCNCHARDFYDIALQNEFRRTNTLVKPINFSNVSLYHNGYVDFNTMILNRNNISKGCQERKRCNTDGSNSGSYLILDYEESLYRCLAVPESTSLNFHEIPTCNQFARDIDLSDVLQESWNKLYLILCLPVLIVPVLVFLYSFRKNFKYFLITMRNSAMLSLINKNKNHDENSIYNYDVFVSYCNEDRQWVLDHLLPHLENDCNISVCLHERDFQVGLSILENIVSCMDRSRLIVLVLSRPFLLSQWCQFEMHLAQHRLLETRREDLILILLEDIPRRLRPTTLHYLMVTKTYIVWPHSKPNDGDSKKELEKIFWKRLKKSLVVQKLRQLERNVSLA